MKKSGSYGTGSIFKPTYKNRKGKLVKSKRWVIQYWHDGRPRRESTGSTDYAFAIDLLKRRQAGELPEVKAADRFDIEAMIKLVEADYTTQGRKSLSVLTQSRFPALRAHLADKDLSELDESDVLQYRDRRKEQGFANATINRELACLRRGLRLGKRRRLVKTVPYISMLKEATPRQGFFEEAEFQAVVAKLSAWWVPLFTVAYVTGWRVNSELCPLEWSCVDFKHKQLRLRPGTTKNDDGRVFPFTPRLEEALLAQQAQVKKLERGKDKIIRAVFPNEKGLKVKSAVYHFKTAVKAADIGPKMQHDFRRTAVRNLEMAGVDRQTAMAMVGHKTEAMYRRYNIVDKGRLDSATKKLAEYEAGLKQVAS